MSFTQDQKDALSAKLDASNVKSRKQSGRQLAYIEGWHAIAEANRIFGFDAWTRETVDIRAVAEKPRKIGEQQKDGWSVTYVAKVRVTAGGVVREGVGAGHGIDVDLGLAHESAIKEAETDAMKRSLMTFGNPFGLALYDKTQENVDRDGGQSKPDPKAVATEMTKALRAAADRTGLDAVWDDVKKDFGKIEKAMQEAVAAVFDMEAARVLVAEFEACPTMADLQALWPIAQGYMRPMPEALKARVTDAKDVRKRALMAAVPSQAAE